MSESTSHEADEPVQACKPDGDLVADVMDGVEVVLRELLDEELVDRVGAAVGVELEAHGFSQVPPFFVVAQRLDKYHDLASLYLSSLGFPCIPGHTPIEDHRGELDEEVKERCKTSLFKLLDAIDELVEQGRASHATPGNGSD